MRSVSCMNKLGNTVAGEPVGFLKPHNSVPHRTQRDSHSCVLLPDPSLPYFVENDFPLPPFVSSKPLSLTLQNRSGDTPDTVSTGRPHNSNRSSLSSAMAGCWKGVWEQFGQVFGFGRENWKGKANIWETEKLIGLITLPFHFLLNNLMIGLSHF